MRSHHYLQGLQYLNQMPIERMFQLFVDGELHVQEKGQKGFEQREPNCMLAFYRGLFFAIQRINQPITVELIKQIHGYASKNVGGDYNLITPGSFRDEGIGSFKVPRTRATIMGVKECVESIRKQKGKYSVDAKLEVLKNDGYLDLTKVSLNKSSLKKFYDNSNSNAEPFVYTPPATQNTEIEKAVAEILQKYLSEIAVAKSHDEKILCIVRYVHEMELLHPFGDGNGRVFVNILLNVLLMQNGFPPVTFYQPNVFDLYSEQELIDVIKDGMSDTLFVIEHSEKPLYGFKPSVLEINSEEKKILEELKTLIKKITREEKIPDEVFNQAKTYAESAWNGQMQVFRACAHGEMDAVKYLSETQLSEIAPQSMSPMYKGMTPIHLAALMNHEELVLLLIDQYPNLLYLKNDDNNKIIDCIAKQGSLQLFIILFNRMRLSALEINKLFSQAVISLNLPIVKWLVENQFINKENIQVSHLIASLSLDEETFHYLWQLFASNKPLKFSILDSILEGIIMIGSISILNIVLNDIDLSTKKTPLEYEVFEIVFINHPRNSSILLKLIETEKDIQLVEDTSGVNLLHSAAIYNRVEIIQALLTRGMDINAVDNQGYTALHYAIENNADDVITFLLEQKNINLNQISNSVPAKSDLYRKIPGKTPIKLAIEKNHIKAFALLIKKGAIIPDNIDELIKVSPLKEAINGLIAESKSSLNSK